MPVKNETPSHAEATLGEAVKSPFEIDLATAAKLGAQADGVEIVMLQRPTEMQGVPYEIPVALRRGATPG